MRHSGGEMALLRNEPSPISVAATSLAFGFLTLFVISLIIFLGLELLPGDLAEAILGQAATPEMVARYGVQHV